MLARAHRVSARIARALAAVDPLVMLMAALAVLCFAVVSLHRTEGLAAPQASSQWRPVTLSVYDAFPKQGSRECIEYDGCELRGKFSLYGNRAFKPDWVRARPIGAVHEKDARGPTGQLLYLGRWVRIAYNDVKARTVRYQDVRIIDECSDGNTPNGECTKNKNWHGNKFLIDLELNTARRLGLDSNSLVDAKFFVITSDKPVFLNGATADFTLPKGK